MRKVAETVRKAIFGSLALWMANILVIGLRLVPVLVIVILRDGDITPWVLASTIVIVLFMVRIGGYLAVLRSHYNMSYSTESPADDPVALKIRRHAPLHLLTWALYPVSLVLLAIV